MRKHFLTYLTLSTMGVSQPLLDLYGRNVTLFSSAKLSRLEILVFLVLVLLGPAGIAIAVDASMRRAGPRANDRARLVLVGLFSALVGLTAARWWGIDNGVAALAVAASFALGVPALFDRSRAFRQWSRWASVVALVVAATVVVQLRPALSTTDGDTTDVVLGRTDTSVLLVVLDEFPLYALLSDDGTVNAERYPGFARLASSSTWYRDTIAASNYTHQAVPAILASARPDTSSRPFLLDHPRNIFTLFDGAMDVDGTEPVTNLCPLRVCGGSGIRTFSLSPRRLREFAKDAVLVYLHRAMPSFVRTRLPPIDGAWGGFAGVADDFVDQLDRGPLAQADAIASTVSDLVASPARSLRVVHAMIPHYPWVLTPDQRVMPRSPEVTKSNSDDTDGVRDDYQALQFQLAATDRALEQAMDALTAAGRWDSTLVVVTADHGISLLEGLEQRDTRFENPDQVADLYRVPLFVKYPGQTEGRTSDCPATTLDVLPTIIDVLDATTSWTFDGSSLGGECPRRGVRTAVSASGETGAFPGGFGDVLERVAHYATLVANEGGAARVAAVGASAGLVGSSLPVAGAPSTNVSWTLDQWMGFAGLSTRRGSAVPALVTGRVRIVGTLAEGTEGLVVANGKVVGVIGEMSGASGDIAYTAILDYSLLDDGDYTVEMYVRDPDGTLHRAAFAD